MVLSSVVSKNAMIKNIIFDMGEILIHFDTKAFTDRYDLPEEDKALLRREIFWGNANWSLCDWGVIDEREVARRACERLPERLHEAAYGIATRWWDPIIPVEGMAEMVRRLKDAGYGIYLLSNAGPTHNTYWPTVPGSEYFDGVVASANEKLVKPQPELFRLICERFGLIPEECLFVDDRETNLAGAEVCGMQSVIFRSAKDLERQLKELGIAM